MKNHKPAYAGLLLASGFTLSLPAFAGIADSYHLTQLGLTDVEHIRNDGFMTSAVTFLNGAGQAAGNSNRYSGANDLGRSAWLYNGATTLNIGLTDATHTRTGGYKYSEVSFLNAAGLAAGYSNRYSGANDLGRSAWLYNGATTLNIGLTDATHTRTGGYKYSEVSFLNAAGLAAGYSNRYSGANDLGRSAWLYNGATTLNIGLTDATHTRTGGYKSSVVTALNAAGKAAGISSRYSGANDLGRSAWLYNGATTFNIGLTDAAHTRTGGYKDSVVKFLNDAGQAAGFSNRFSGTNGVGLSAWLYNGTTTLDIGLTDAAHTRNDGYTLSDVSILNAAGHVAGYANRYSGANETGVSAWLYNGTTTSNIGLTGAAHTRNDGYKLSWVTSLNAAGQAAGYANRYSGANFVGWSAWLYNGATTLNIGLTDASHTGSDGYQWNQVTRLNAAGQAAGEAAIMSGTNGLGQSAWLYNGATTVRIGLTDAAHTRTGGYKDSVVQFLNDAGQVAGYSKRYSDFYSRGQSAWLYDDGLDQTFALVGSLRDDGYAFSQVDYLGDDGLVLGRYELFDGAASKGYRAFAWTVEDGIVDLGSRVEGGLDSDWAYLASTYRANTIGQIAGHGTLTQGGQGAYLLTAVPVPEPKTYVLMLAGLGLVGWNIRRKQRVAMVMQA